MLCCFPYGAILATLFYGIFVSLVFTRLVGADGPVCEREPCRSEGVDNATINWTSDFYVAAWSIFLAVHYFIRKSKSSRKGHMALVFMGLGYLLRGVAQREFSNSGHGDGKGMRAFYIVWPISYLLLTASIYEFSSYTRRMWRVFRSRQRPKCCGLFEVILTETLTIFVCVLILAGSIWSIVSTDIHVPRPIDEFPSDPNLEIPVSVQMIIYGNMVWFACHTLFWIAAASMLGTLAMAECEFVWGLPNSLAAAGIIVMQLATGTLWVVIQVLQQHKEPRGAVASYSSVLFHYGLVMTALFAHNLISTVRIMAKPSATADSNNMRGVEGPNDSDKHALDNMEALEEGEIVNQMPSTTSSVISEASKASVPTDEESAESRISDEPCDTSMDTVPHSNSWRNSSSRKHRSNATSNRSISARKEAARPSIVEVEAKQETVKEEARQPIEKEETRQTDETMEARQPFTDDEADPAIANDETPTQQTATVELRQASATEEAQTTDSANEERGWLDYMEEERIDWASMLRDDCLYYTSPVEHLWAWGSSIVDSTPPDPQQGMAASEQKQKQSSEPAGLQPTERDASAGSTGPQTSPQTSDKRPVLEGLTASLMQHLNTGDGTTIEQHRSEHDLAMFQNDYDLALRVHSSSGSEESNVEATMPLETYFQNGRERSESSRASSSDQAVEGIYEDSSNLPEQQQYLLSRSDEEAGHAQADTALTGEEWSRQREGSSSAHANETSARKAEATQSGSTSNRPIDESSWTLGSLLAGIREGGGEEQTTSGTAQKTVVVNGSTEASPWGSLFALISSPETINEDDCRDENAAFPRREMAHRRQFSI